MSTSYLVIRPLSEDPSEVEDLIKGISHITGLDPTAIRERTTGTALKILLTGREKDNCETDPSSNSTHKNQITAQGIAFGMRTFKWGCNLTTDHGLKKAIQAYNAAYNEYGGQHSMDCLVIPNIVNNHDV